MSKTEITVWERLDEKNKVWNHNHISDGYTEATEPTPMSEEQKKSWKGAKWRKFNGHLQDQKVVLQNQEA